MNYTETQTLSNQIINNARGEILFSGEESSNQVKALYPGESHVSRGKSCNLVKSLVPRLKSCNQVKVV